MAAYKLVLIALTPSYMAIDLFMRNAFCFYTRYQHILVVIVRGLHIASVLLFLC